jgi:hypothetical protein
MNQRLTSIDDLVSAFGGPTALGDWLGVGASTVSNWQARGSIPTGWNLRLYLEAEHRGFDIDLTVFGFERLEDFLYACNPRDVGSDDATRAGAAASSGEGGDVGTDDFLPPPEVPGRANPSSGEK